MATLIAELFAFAVAVFVIVRYVVPPARKAMANQQKAVAKQVEDAAQARRDLDAAQARYDETMEQARTDAAQIRDRARAEADFIGDEVADRSEQDVARIHQRGGDQLATARQQAVRELRRDTGELSVRLAGRIVYEALTDPARRAGTIDRFLDELEAMSQQDEPTATGSGSIRMMTGVSRDSMSAAREALDRELSGVDTEDAAAFGNELFAVTDLLDQQRSLLRTLADPSLPDESRADLVRRLLGQRLSDRAVRVLAGLAAARWSRPTHLLDAVETLARESFFAVAEAEGGLDAVEDQLFRFGRILDGQPRLASLLSDPAAEPARRVTLLDTLVADKVNGPTLAVLRQTVSSRRRRALEPTLEELAALVAARRERSIATVTAPLTPTDEQQQRLAGVLGRIYGREVSLQIEVDDAMLGGLVVAIGEDRIDGSVAAQLERAAQGLPQ